MRVAIMQPYFMPYIGYFQLIGAVDLFIVYDNIKYTKKGWINRNRMLQDGQDIVFSLPLKGGSDALDVRDRSLAGDFDRAKLLRRFEEAYRRAPYFRQGFALVEQSLGCAEQNLFGFLHHSIASACEHLGIATEIQASSSIPIDHALKNTDKVVALCQAVGARSYVNAIGGTALYAKEEFRAHGLDLAFVQSRPLQYAQFGQPFVPWLSIVDVLMFNSLDTVRGCVESGYDLI
ncbi:WbqC family protein [Variovorax sp. J22P271]|uniref:WbqC family protein n=1 Tax=Variovorax davisae TaxID=3053515 RepID=UPI0025760F45|nr:WbqC family protein [Variovorax sp. J22P271]MDM0030638.1 WbqC family protein [Variovorax sp. J22P271]